MCHKTGIKMNKKFNAVSAEKLAGLQIDLLQKMRNDKISVEELELFLNMSQTKRRKIFGLSELETFRIGDVFGHRVSGLVPQYQGDNFKNWLFVPSQNKTITVPTTLSKLTDYVLPKNMTDTEIQNMTKSIPMDEDTFWTVLYLLIIKPELGKELLGYELDKSKYYIFHVTMADGTVRAVYVRWSGDEWDCYAYAFDYGSAWYQGCVFVRFATT